MPDDDTSAWGWGLDLLLFVLLPCALMTGIAYVYMTYFMPQPYAGVVLQEGVQYVSARRFETHGLEALAAGGSAIERKAWSPPEIASGIPSTLTILIHGYNAQEGKVALYFADLATSLLIDARHVGPLIVFDWPAVSVPLDEQPTAERLRHDLHSHTKNAWTQPAYEFNAYKMDQRKAESVGVAAFATLLKQLSAKPDTTVHVIAHSMGCYLLARAMQQHPAAFSRIGSMIWLAPDIDAAEIGEPWFRAVVETLRTGLFVHYSHNDTTLSVLSRAANGAPRLGATGPRDGGASMHKLEFIDMTSALGADKVHTGYLRRNSPSLPLIARQIAIVR